jgi:ArsR family transcriptional regulator
MQTRAATGTSTQAVFESLAKVARAIGHAHRLELLECLAQGSRCVEELADATHLTVANTSRHLQLLSRGGLVHTHRDGKRVYYHLAGYTEVVALIKFLGVVGERNVPEVLGEKLDFFQRRDPQGALSRKDLASRLVSGPLMILLDVRPPEEYTLGHLPGAINLPFESLLERPWNVPTSREIVVYSRGPYCSMAFEAVAALRKRGYRVSRLARGFSEWRAAGMQVVFPGAVQGVRVQVRPAAPRLRGKLPRARTHRVFYTYPVNCDIDDIL